MLKAVLALIPESDPVKTQYKAEMLKFINIAQNTRDTNQLSTNQESKWLDYNSIISKTNELYREFKKTNIVSDGLILSIFYSGGSFAPYRLEVVSNLKMYSPTVDVDKVNCIQDDKIVLNIYKTDKTYGKVTQYIRKKLSNIVKQYYSQKPNPKNNHLNTDYRDNQSSIRSIGAKLDKTFGASCNILRKLYITNLFYRGRLTTNKQMKNVALEMRDSVQVMLEYRWIKE